MNGVIEFVCTQNSGKLNFYCRVTYLPFRYVGIKFQKLCDAVQYTPRNVIELIPIISLRIIKSSGFIWILIVQRDLSQTTVLGVGYG